MEQGSPETRSTASHSFHFSGGTLSIADLPAEAHRWRAFRDVGLGSVRVCEEIALLEAPIIEIFSVARCRGSLSVETGGLFSR